MVLSSSAWWWLQVKASPRSWRMHFKAPCVSLSPLSRGYGGGGVIRERPPDGEVHLFSQAIYALSAFSLSLSIHSTILHVLSLSWSPPIFSPPLFVEQLIGANLHPFLKANLLSCAAAKDFERSCSLLRDIALAECTFSHAKQKAMRITPG